jgi:hypothetical protein
LRLSKLAFRKEWKGTMQNSLIGAGALVGLIFFLGCDLLSPKACPADLQWRVTPTEADLRVGESITVRAEALGCGGTEPLEEDMRWISGDPSVAGINEITGRITAIGAGSTTITGEDLGPYHIGPVQISITVSP